MLIKKTVSLWVALLLTTAVQTFAAADQSDSAKEESPLRIVPLITSTPLTGTGLGLAISYLYRADEGSSMSQLQVGGQYSDTSSTNFFIRNNAFFDGNRIISSSLLSVAKTNSDFKGDDGRKVDYKIESIVLTQKLLFQFKENLYLGGRAIYKELEYSPNNAAGGDFLFDNGIVDEESVGIGFAAAFDTRKNKYFPRDAYWVDVDIDSFPNSFGADDTYYKMAVNARYYTTGFAAEDVWASQFYGEFSSYRTPDSGLSTLSGKSLLRGFPAGQFKARFLNGMQTEYRYQVVGTPYRLIAFIGAAYLSGGSYGQGDRERDDDDMYYAGGIGLRYAIQARTGVDLRLDVVTTSENEESLYVALNQAF
jgi:hypothetical protein